MAEIRKHDPDSDDGLGKLVRDALGEKIRPVEPGSAQSAEPADERTDDDTGKTTHIPEWPDEDNEWTMHF